MDRDLGAVLDRWAYNPSSRKDMQNLQSALVDVNRILTEDYGDTIPEAYAEKVIMVIDKVQFWEIAQTAIPALREPFDPETNISRPRALQFILEKIKHRLPNRALVEHLGDSEKYLITTLSDALAYLKDLSGPQETNECCDEVLHKLATELTDRLQQWRIFREDERLHSFSVLKGGKGVFCLHAMDFNSQHQAQAEAGKGGLGSSRFASAPVTRGGWQHPSMVKNEAASGGGHLKQEGLRPTLKDGSHGVVRGGEAAHGISGGIAATAHPPKLGKSPVLTFATQSSSALGQSKLKQTSAKGPLSVGLQNSDWAPEGPGYERDPESKDWRNAWLYQDPAYYTERGHRVSTALTCGNFDVAGDLRSPKKRMDVAVTQEQAPPAKPTFAGPVSSITKGFADFEVPRELADRFLRRQPRFQQRREITEYDAASEAVVTESSGDVNVAEASSALQRPMTTAQPSHGRKASQEPVEQKTHTKTRETSPSSGSETSPKSITRFYNAYVAGAEDNKGDEFPRLQASTGRAFREFLDGEFETYPALRPVVRDMFQSNIDRKHLFVKGLYKAFRDHAATEAGPPQQVQGPSAEPSRPTGFAPKSTADTAQQTQNLRTTPDVTSTPRPKTGLQGRDFEKQEPIMTHPPYNRNLPLREQSDRINASMGFGTSVSHGGSNPRTPLNQKSLDDKDAIRPPIIKPTPKPADKKVESPSAPMPAQEMPEKKGSEQKPKEKRQKEGLFKYLLDSDEEDDSVPAPPLYDPHRGIQW